MSDDQTKRRGQPILHPEGKTTPVLVTLPTSMVASLDKAVGKGGRSRKIATLVRAWLKRREGRKA